MRLDFPASVDDSGVLRPDDPLAWRAGVSRFRGKRIVLSLEAERPLRRMAQTRRYWSLLVPLVAEVLSVGREVPLSRDQGHYVCKCAFLGVEDTPLGPVPRSTSDSVLAFGCGDLKEADLSHTVRTRGLARFLALLETEAARRAVEASVGHMGVSTGVATVYDWIGGHGVDHDQEVHLAYSAGPFDVLSRATAALLALALFRSLKPGGTLVVANLARGIRKVGYAEAFMDWHTVYRYPREMFAVASRIPEAWIADRRPFAAEGGRVSFLVVGRA